MKTMASAKPTSLACFSGALPARAASVIGPPRSLLVQTRPEL
jgi:hypothetical protein